MPFTLHATPLTIRNVLRCGIGVKEKIGQWCGMSREDQHFRLRLPADLRALVEAAAAENRRSITAEILARLEASFQQADNTNSFDVKQTTEMSMLTMLNFIEIILDSDKSGAALKDISRNVRAQFKKDYPDHPLLKKLTDIDGMKERTRASLSRSKKPD